MYIFYLLLVLVLPFHMCVQSIIDIDHYILSKNSIIHNHADVINYIAEKKMKTEIRKFKKVHNIYSAVL